MNNPEPETRFAVLLFTDIVGSTDLKARHGVPAFKEALRLHNQFFERAARECPGFRVLRDQGDGYFAEATSVVEAVRFALLFQHAMHAGPWGSVPLATRVGIHAGEVTALDGPTGDIIVAPAADLAARVMSLAVGGQILLTRFPFDETRHFVREHPAFAGRATPPLRWLAHGPYLMKGRDEPMEIFEVGAEGLAPLAPPPDGEKAKRAIRPGEEETLGWRPAIGLEIPGRAGWRLVELLGRGGFGEVWTGEHAKFRQRRAFKFCFDDERLRALKREVTLVRLLRTALGDRDDIVRFHELKLDEPPFYLESDLAPHGNLLQWAEKQGGLANIPLAQRIALVAHTATALAAAHSIGVLHKDIKPTNILIFDAPDGGVRPRLVDFGIGTLADPAVLAQHGVTSAGFTRTAIKHSTGTPTYSPPEYLAGKPYTVQGDIYGLGVLLYQLVTADSSRPIAHGWERDITDPLLREDIAACVDGEPARRLPNAADLAGRLLHLDQRRAEVDEKERLDRESAAHAQAVAAVARRRRAFAQAGIGFLLAALIVSGLWIWKGRPQVFPPLVLFHDDFEDYGTNGDPSRRWVFIANAADDREHNRIVSDSANDGKPTYALQLYGTRLTGRRTNWSALAYRQCAFTTNMEFTFRIRLDSNFQATAASCSVGGHPDTNWQAIGSSFVAWTTKMEVVLGTNTVCGEFAYDRWQHIRCKRVREGLGPTSRVMLTLWIDNQLRGSCTTSQGDDRGEALDESNLSYFFVNCRGRVFVDDIQVVALR